MLRVNLWQKLLREGFEREPVKRAQKNKETAQLAGVGDADRKGVWEGDVICQLGGGDGHAQHVHSQKREEQRRPHVGKQFTLF